MFYMIMQTEHFIYILQLITSFSCLMQFNGATSFMHRMVSNVFSVLWVLEKMNKDLLGAVLFTL